MTKFTPEMLRAAVAQDFHLTDEDAATLTGDTLGELTRHAARLRLAGRDTYASPAARRLQDRIAATQEATRAAAQHRPTAAAVTDADERRRRAVDALRQTRFAPVAPPPEPTDAYDGGGAPLSTFTNGKD